MDIVLAQYDSQQWLSLQVLGFRFALLVLPKVLPPATIVYLQQILPGVRVAVYGATKTLFVWVGWKKGPLACLEQTTTCRWWCTTGAAPACTSMLSADVLIVIPCNLVLQCAMQGL
jgi:hypothetical protein